TCSPLASLVSLISIRAGGACSRPASEFILLKRTFISTRAKFGRRSFSSAPGRLANLQCVGMPGHAQYALEREIAIGKSRLSLVPGIRCCLGATFARHARI